MKKYKIVFSDIDGTLLDTKHQVRENTRKKILELESIGIPFVLVSARMPDGIYPIQKNIGITAPIVAYSGGLVLNEKGEIIKSIGLEIEKAVELKNTIKDRWSNICLSFYSENFWIAENTKDEWIIQEEFITGLKCIEGDFSKILTGNKKVHKLMCMGDNKIITEIEGILKARYSELSVYRSKDTYLEIMDGKVLKSNAVKILCEDKKIDIEDSVSFGDNYNDVDMIKATGLGVAMGNAPQGVKLHADIVTLDNDSEGLLHILNQLSF